MSDELASLIGSKSLVITMEGESSQFKMTKYQLLLHDRPPNI